MSKYFEGLVEEQGFLDSEQEWGKMLALVPEKKRHSLQEEWRERPQDSGRTRWRRLINDVSVSSPNHDQMVSAIKFYMYIIITRQLEGYHIMGLNLLRI